MFGPFPVEDALARALTVEGVRIVGGVADFAAAQEQPPRSFPALYVLREETGGKPAGGTGRLIQPIDVTLKLVMWVSHAGGSQKAEAAMTEFERAVRARFFGWRPSTDYQAAWIRASGADTSYGATLIRQLLLTSGYHQTTEATI